MPIRVPNFALPLPSETPAFSNPNELREILIRELGILGWQGLSQNIQVKPVEVYGPEGWRTVPNEYEVNITHPKAEGQSWFGRVRGTPNETLAIKAGEGWELRRGELRTAGLGGIGEPSNVVPWYTGIQSFARRVSAGFGEWATQKADLPPQYTMRENVMDYYRALDKQRHPWGAQKVGPTGEAIPGRIPASYLYMSPTEMESPRNVRFQAGTYAVPFVPPVEGQEAGNILTRSVQALHRQVVERGLSAGTPWHRLFQGYVHEPSATAGAVFVSPFAAGSLREEEGMTVADMLTPKPYKQSVVGGRREVATPLIMTGDIAGQRQLQPVPEQFLRQASVTLRAGETPYTGIPLQAVTAVGELPWQSGAKQFRLPPGLERYVTGMGGQVVAGRLAHETEVLRAGGLEELVRSPFQMDVSQLGRVLDPGRRVTYTKGLPEGQNLAYTAGQQMEQLLSYRLNLPQAWREGMTREQLTPWLQKLQTKGFQDITFGAQEQPIIDIEKWAATIGAPKGTTKGQINQPFIGVEQALRTETGVIPYQVLQEAKFIEPVVLNALQAMQDPYKFLSTIYKGDKEMAGALSTMRRAKMPLSLEELGMISGRYQTGEQTLVSITEQFRQYPDQQELIRRFGMGVVGGTAPIEQFTSRTLRGAREGLMAHLQSQNMGLTDIKQYLRAFRKNVAFDEGTGLYTLSMNQPQWVVSPSLATLVQESVGVGSTQGEMYEGMQAQGYGKVASFLERNMANLFPESPARGALQNVARGWMATRYGAPPATEQFYTVTPDMAKQVRTAITHATQVPGQGPIGQTQLMALYEQEMRSAAGVPANQPEPVYWSQNLRAGMAGGGAFRELESLLAEINKEGGIDFQTQAQVSTRFNKFMGQFLERTELGQEDDWLRREIQDFQSIYTDTDQLRKRRGGIFSRYGGTSLLQPGQALMSEEGLRRYYLMQGGNPRSQREWGRYLRTMEGTTGIGLRWPAPNIGTAELPGSIQPLQIMTSQPLLRNIGERAKRLGPMMSDAAKRAGLMLPEIMTSSLYGASLGDIDLDPMTLLPLTFRTGRGKWESFRGEVGTNEDYSKWLREITAKQAPAQQQRTFNALFGSQAAQFNPWGQNMQAAIARMMGPPGERLLTQQIGGEISQIREGLLGRRIALGTEQFQEFGEEWNTIKTRGMGVAYNVYRRRPEAAGAFLNVPQRLAREITDIGAKGYQMPLDFQKYQTFWENLMGTSGFQSKGADQPVQWGVNIGGQGEFTYSALKWNPEEEDVGALARLTGAGLAASDMPADWVSSMIMQIPERGQMTEADQESMLRARRADISKRIEEARASTGTGETASNRIARLMMQLEEEGAIGERSYAAVSTMARAFEYTGKEQGIAANRERLLNVRAGMARRGGFRIGGEMVPYEKAEQIYGPLSTMFEFLKHTKGEASYKDPLTIAETILAAEKGGWAGTQVMKQFRETWGEIAGIPAKGPIQVRHPITGNLMMIQEQADIEAMRQASQILESQREAPYQRTRQLLTTIAERRGTPLQASELAYPEGDISQVPKEILRAGTRAHFEVGQYLKAANLPGVEAERRLSMPGLLGARADIIQPVPGGIEGAREVAELKVQEPGQPVERYTGQLGAYAMRMPVTQGRVMQISRGQAAQIRAEEAAAAQARGGTISEYRQAVANIGRRQLETGMAQSQVFTAEQIGPAALESSIAAFMGAKGIPVPPVAAPPTYQVPATGGGGGQNIPSTGTIPGFAEPPQEPGRRAPLIRMGRIRGGQVMPPTSYMRADDLRAALQGAGIEGGGEWEEEGGLGEGPEQMTLSQIKRAYAGRPDMAEVMQPLINYMEQAGVRGNRVIFGARKALGPQAARGAWLGAKNIFERAYGTIGEGSELTNRGILSQTYQQLPQLLSQMFPGQIDRETIAGLSPLQAIAQAPQMVRERGLSFRRLVEANPQLRQALEVFNVSGKMFRGVIPSMADIPENETDIAKAIQAVGAGGTAVGATMAARLGPAGEELGNVYSSMWSLQQQYTGSKAGRAGLQPVSEARADLARRWLTSFKEMDDAIQKQVTTISTYKGRQLDLNEVLERGEKLTDRHYNTFLRYNKAFEAAEYNRDKAAEKLTRLAGWEAPVARRLTQAELSSVLAGKPSAEIETAFEQYEAAQGRAGLSRLQMATAAMQPGRPVPGEEGATQWGMMGRRMLGGFGLMYMRSIAGIIGGGAQLGYPEFQQQQQAIQAAYGAQFGGMVPTLSPDEYVKRMQAPYAGGGWAALKTIQGDLARNQPGMMGALGMAQAGVGAFGAMSWLAMMAPAAAPFIAPVTAGAMLGTAALNIYGAATRPNENAVNIATQIARGTQQLRGGEIYGSVLGNLTNWGVYGYAINRQEQQPMVERLEAMRQYQIQGGKDLRGFLQQRGVPAANVNYWMSMYSQVQAAQYPEVPVEGLIGADVLQQRFGINLTQGAGGTLPLLGAGLAQGIPYQQAGMMAAAAPGRGFEEQQRIAGINIENWLARGGLTQEQLEKLQTGAGRYQALGFLAPTPGILHGRPEMRYMERGPGGREFPVVVPGIPSRDLLAEYKERLGAIPQTQAEIMAQQANLAQRRALIGLPYQMPRLETYEGTWTEQQRIRSQQQIAQQQPVLAAQEQVYGGWMGLGMAPAQINMQQYAGMGLGQLGIVSQQQQYAQGLQGVLTAFGGMGQQRAETITQRFAGLPAPINQMLTKMLQGDPMAYARMATMFPGQFAQMPLNLPGVAGTQIPTSYLGMTDLRESQVATGMYQATPTGLPWGMSSLAMPGITSAQMANRIWGAGYQQRTDLSQGLIQAMIGGGQFGGQAWQLQQQAQQQMAQSGIQLQQLALQRAFTTGVGLNQYAGTVNPQTGQPFGFNTGKFGFNIPGVGGFTSQGGGFWGVEDAFRNLNWMQQQWGFGQQREQLSMQDRFFQQNFALNMQQSQMQRGWTRQDWGFQDQMRGMQWGWRQEDFQENLRFMTGRERRLAERQMGRETILYGAEGEQIDRQRKRQEELWKLEDERFRIQAQQQKEQVKFQEEAIKKQEQFFEARKKLEEEQVKIQRAYQIEQMKLQEQQIKSAAGYAATQLEIAKTMQEFSKFSQEAAAKGNLFNEDTMEALIEAFAEIYGWVIKIEEKAGGGGGKGGGGGDKVPKGPRDYIPEQYGGDVFAGQDLIVGERGVEKFRPYFSGQIIPTHKLDPWQNGTPIQMAGPGDGKGQIRLVINLGGNLLREFILSAVDKEIDV